MTTVLRLTRYAALGFAGGALLTITAGLGCAVFDWQHRNHVAQKVATQQANAFHRRWLA